MRILIVDDHEGIRKKICELLARPGVDTLGYATGEAAIEAARTFQPDWVIMDVHLPGMSGLEAANIIHTELPSARIVVLSTNDPHYLREAAREAGADEFLIKHQLADLRRILYGRPPND